MPGSCFGRAPSSANDADWIDRRVRTMSSGYVKVTDVTPARPPQVRRDSGVRLSPGCRSKKCYKESVSTTVPPKRVNTTTASRDKTHPLIKIITPKLHRGIRHNPDTIRAIPPHKPPPPLLAPHLRQRLAHAQLVRVAPRALDLEQDLEALQRRHDGARHGARHAAATEGGHDGLRDGVQELVVDGEALRGRRGRGRGGEGGCGPRVGLWPPWGLGLRLVSEMCVSEWMECGVCVCVCAYHPLGYRLRARVPPEGIAGDGCVVGQAFRQPSPGIDKVCVRTADIVRLRWSGQTPVGVDRARLPPRGGRETSGVWPVRGAAQIRGRVCNRV